jgi:hypothetical protein
MNPFETLKYYFGGQAAREMRELAEENRAMRVANEVRLGEFGSPSFAELTRGGNEWMQNTMAKYIGEYNPDEIPLLTYDKMRWDGQLRLGLMTIKLPIMARDFWVECEDKDIKTFVHQNLKEIWRPYIKSVLTALDYGFAPHEKIWQIAEEYRVQSTEEKVDYTRDVIKYKSIKDLCQRTVSVDYNEKLKFKGFYQNKNRQNEAYVPSEKAFVFTHDKEWGNIYGWSRLKPAYPYWYTYWILDAWHERWLQKRGIPPVVVKYPIGKTQTATSGTTPTFKDNQEIARDAAKSFQPDSIITLPSDEIKTQSGKTGEWSIDVLQDTTRIDAFVDAKEKLDVRKLRSILVPERAVTQDVGTGSFRMAESHIWIMMESLKGLIGDIAEQTNEFIIPPLVKYNFGDKAPKATVTIEEIGRELTASLFEIYLGMIQTGKAHPSVKKIEKVLNVPAETEEEKKEREEKEKEGGIPPQVAQRNQDMNKEQLDKLSTSFFNRQQSGAPRQQQLSERIWRQL